MNGKRIIGIGIIGTGFARTTQIPGFRACEGARIVAIASGHRENADRVAREFGIPQVAETWQDLINNEDVNLISIVTPPSTHLEMALAALNAGKAVLCEKPMAMNASESEVMSKRATEARVPALLDHELRFLSGRRKMREMIMNGEIGEIRHAKLVYRSDIRAAAARGWDWWSDVREGGGALGAIGSHAIDGFRWMLGTEVKNVFCSLSTHVKERFFKPTGEMRAVTTDDEANMILRFAPSALAPSASGTVSVSVVESGKPIHRFEVFGSKGALWVEDGGELFHSKVGQSDWHRVETARDPFASGMRDSGWSRAFTVFGRTLVAALREGRTKVEDAATFEDGHRTQLVLDAARQSHETGAFVTL